MDRFKLLHSLSPKEVFDESFHNLSVSKTFGEEIIDMMKALHINSSMFCEMTGLNKTILSEMKKTDYKPDFRTVISICIGFKREYIEAEKILKKAGYTLILERKIHYAYYLFMTKYKYRELGIEDYNYLLEKWGFDKKYFLGSHSNK